ncbi:hypothetical protein Q7C36_011466 [Tachysurus vachellii]|uniref:Uncharacterized protein n=1 Tax=Tachysurus vachellii TaxID=175792 RepID=A0AA88MQH2_TACVA|nr:hypothetical protein Q7C36_011466 [Tachysurus vachellii]
MHCELRMTLNLELHYLLDKRRNLQRSDSVQYKWPADREPCGGLEAEQADGSTQVAGLKARHLLCPKSEHYSPLTRAVMMSPMLHSLLPLEGAEAVDADWLLPPLITATFFPAVQSNSGDGMASSV